MCTHSLQCHTWRWVPVCTVPIAVPWTICPLNVASLGRCVPKQCDHLWFWKGEGHPLWTSAKWGKVSVLASRNENGEDIFAFIFIWESFLSVCLSGCLCLSFCLVSQLSFYIHLSFSVPTCVVSVWCLNVVCMSFDFLIFRFVFLLYIVSSFASFFIRLLNIIYCVVWI